jgi:hypothetical protein
MTSIGYAAIRLRSSWRAAGCRGSVFAADPIAALRMHHTCAM